MENSYLHTQRGWAMQLLFSGLAGLSAIVVAILLVKQGIPRTAEAMQAQATPLILLTVFILLAKTFGSLTVRVTHSAVELWFGPGWIRRKFLLSELQSFGPVRNSFWMGWGIRYIPRGWIFNVHGLDAVELVMRHGKRYRIGTDEPDKLTEAIRKMKSPQEGTPQEFLAK